MSWTGFGLRSFTRPTSGTCLCGRVAMSHGTSWIHGALVKMPVGFMCRLPVMQASHFTSLTPFTFMSDRMKGMSQIRESYGFSIEK